MIDRSFATTLALTLLLTGCAAMAPEDSVVARQEAVENNKARGSISSANATRAAGLLADLNRATDNAFALDVATGRLTARMNRKETGELMLRHVQGVSPWMNEITVHVGDEPPRSATNFGLTLNMGRNGKVIRVDKEGEHVWASAIQVPVPVGDPMAMTTCLKSMRALADLYRS